MEKPEINESESRVSNISVSILKFITSEGHIVDDNTKTLKEICDLWEVKAIDVFSSFRYRAAVEARQVLMFSLKYELGLTLEQIGELVSGRDHSTVSHSIMKVNELASVDKDYLYRIIALGLDKWLK